MIPRHAIFRIFFLAAAIAFAALLPEAAFMPAPARATSEVEPAAVMPISIGEEEQLLKEARAHFENRDYRTAINRLETVVFIKKNVSPEIKELLVDALGRQIEAEIAQKNYKEAASLNMKVLTLREAFDFVWLNKLLNIYMLSGNYRKTHELCLEILKKQDVLALPKENLAKIHGKLAVVYASFKDTTRAFDSLIEAAVCDPNIRTVKSYSDMIFPKFLEPKALLDHAAVLRDAKKTREAYIAAFIHSRIAPDAAASVKLAGELAAIDPALKELFKSAGGADAAASRPSGTGPAELAAAQAPVWNDIPAESTSSVVLSNVPSQIRESGSSADDDRPAAKNRQGSREFEMLMSRSDELLTTGKYDDAAAELEKALKIAPDNRKEEIKRRIFSAYWKSREEYIKIAAYSFILLLMLVLFYYFNPMSLFSREQYGLINVSKTLRNGIAAIDEKKYQKAVTELEKLVEMKLSTTETVALYLNLGLAYFHLNSFASALMALRKVLQFDYENIDAYKLLGRIYVKTKERSHKAMEVFNFLIDKKIFDLEMLKAVAAYNGAQNIIDDRAIQIAMEIVAAEPGNEVAGRTLVKYFNRVKRIDDEALNFVERFGEAHPRDVEAHIALLEMLYRRKEFTRIITECSALFAYAVDNILVHSIFIDSIVNLNKPKMLLTEYDRLARENPGSSVTNFIFQSIRSLVSDRTRPPEVDYALAVRVNFGVCHKCFHLNLNEFNNCQRCGSALRS